MAASLVLQALARLAGAGTRAAPAMESSAAALRAARIGRAARGTESMEGVNRGFSLVKPPSTSLVPRGSTMPVGGAPPAGPGTGVALRGSTMPAAPPAGGLPAGIAAPPPAGGGALVSRGANLPAGSGSPDIYGKLGGAALTGVVGANVAGQSPTSIFDFLPQRAEGDPAGAMNRSNAPSVDYGMSDAAYRFKDLPGYEGEGSPMVGDRESFGLSDAAYRQLADLATSAGRSDAEYRREGPPRAPATANIPMPTPRPSDGPSSAELWGRYNESMDRDGGGDPALFALADKATREGRASGGAASSGGTSSGGGGKDAAIHKALEIIHHLLTRR